MKPKRAASISASAGRGRVICGTDFSEPSGHAVRAAAALARRLGGPLVLAHAVEFPAAGKYHAQALRWLMASRKRTLTHAATSLGKDGLRVEPVVAAGRPDEVLTALARRGPARLIVVGSLGRRGAGRWLLGSASARTAQSAAVPTLVVRQDTSFVKWAAASRPLKLLVCFNFTPTSEAALQWVAEWAALGPCEITVAYVDWPLEQGARLGTLPDAGSALEREVRERAGEILEGLPFRVRAETTWSRPDARLPEMAREEGADLLVVGSHQYRGFEKLWHTSVSSGLLHGALMNVVVVPLATARGPSPSRVKSFKRVLACTDFSPLADRAVPAAYAALPCGGTVKLLHVMAAGRATRLAADAEECGRRLRALIPTDAAARGIVTEIEVLRQTDVATAVCQAAERFGADAICMATHGRSGLSRLLLGSVARAILDQTRRPLLLVRVK